MPVIAQAVGNWFVAPGYGWGSVGGRGDGETHHAGAGVAAVSGTSSEVTSELPYEARDASVLGASSSSQPLRGATGAAPGASSGKLIGHMQSMQCLKSQHFASPLNFPGKTFAVDVALISALWKRKEVLRNLVFLL